jgi:hypothetical protein
MGKKCRRIQPDETVSENTGGHRREAHRNHQACALWSSFLQLQGNKKYVNVFFELYVFQKFYSIVLLAIADAKSRFLVVDIGASGRNSDSTQWISSPLRMFLESPEADLPPSQEDMLP